MTSLSGDYVFVNSENDTQASTQLYKKRNVIGNPYDLSD